MRAVAPGCAAAARAAAMKAVRSKAMGANLPARRPEAKGGGRFVFGIGAGWNVEEMEHHGVRYKTCAVALRPDRPRRILLEHVDEHVLFENLYTRRPRAVGDSTVPLLYFAGVASDRLSWSGEFLVVSRLELPSAICGRGFGLARSLLRAGLEVDLNRRNIGEQNSKQGVRASAGICRRRMTEGFDESRMLSSVPKSVSSDTTTRPLLATTSKISSSAAH